MEQTECSETSAYKLQTPGNYPKESIQHTEHVESLKSRLLMPFRVNKLYHTGMNNRPPEDEPSSSKHVQDIKIKKLNYEFRKCAFRWFMLFNYITMHVAKKHTKMIIGLIATKLRHLSKLYCFYLK